MRSPMTAVGFLRSLWEKPIWEVLMEKWAPLPKGFPQYNKLGSVRHVCELQGVMTS